MTELTPPGERTRALVLEIEGFLEEWAREPADRVHLGRGHDAATAIVFACTKHPRLGPMLHDYIADGVVPAGGKEA